MHLSYRQCKSPDCCVQEILFEGGRASGVKLSDGSLIRASKAVVSNCSAWDTVKLLPKEAVPADYLASIQQIPINRSFMHLHVGFSAAGERLQLSGLECFGPLAHLTSWCNAFSVTSRLIPTRLSGAFLQIWHRWGSTILLSTTGRGQWTASRMSCS